MSNLADVRNCVKEISRLAVAYGTTPEFDNAYRLLQQEFNMSLAKELKISEDKINNLPDSTELPLYAGHGFRVLEWWWWTQVRKEMPFSCPVLQREE